MKIWENKDSWTFGGVAFIVLLVMAVGVTAYQNRSDSKEYRYMEMPKNHATKEQPHIEITDTELEFMEYIKENAGLEPEDGKVLDLPISAVSDSAQAYLGDDIKVKALSLINTAICIEYEDGVIHVTLMSFTDGSTEKSVYNRRIKKKTIYWNKDNTEYKKTDN